MIVERRETRDEGDRGKRQKDSVLLTFSPLPPTSSLVGFLLCHSQLSSYPGASDLWKLALYDGFYLTLCRDEAIAVHGVFEKLLSDSKDKKWVVENTIS